MDTTMKITASVSAALALFAGALLYFSDHDNIDRHWRIALVMVLSALLVMMWPALRAKQGAAS